MILRNDFWPKCEKNENIFLLKTILWNHLIID